MVFEAGKIEDADGRLELMSTLKEAGFNPTKQAFKRDAVYSRFLRLNKHTDLDDAEDIRTSIETLLEKAQNDFEKLEQVCCSVFGGASGK